MAHQEHGAIGVLRDRRIEIRLVRHRVVRRTKPEPLPIALDSYVFVHQKRDIDGLENRT